MAMPSHVADRRLLVNHAVALVLLMSSIQMAHADDEPATSSRLNDFGTGRGDRAHRERSG
jgi:hypothetical protein